MSEGAHLLALVRELRARSSLHCAGASHGLQNYDLRLLGGFVPVGRPVLVDVGGGGQRGRRVAHDPARPADPERRLGLEPPQVLQAADHPVHERAAARGALRDDARRRERARRARRRARAARARRRLPVRHARVGHADRPVHAGLRGAGGDGARGPRPRRAEVGPGAPRRPPRGADDRARAREARLRGGAAADDRRGEPRAAAQDDVRAGAARLERPRGRDLRQPGARRAPSDRPARLGGRRPPCPPPSRPLLSRLPSSFLPPSSLLVTLAFPWRRSQDEKAEEFDAALRARSEARELYWDERIEHTRQLKLTEKDREISQIQRRRIKALRKLSEARKKVEGGRQPRDVVMEYADYGSEAYAPMTRNGNITLDKQVLARASPRAPTPHPSPPPPSPPPHRPPPSRPPQQAHRNQTKPQQLETHHGHPELEAGRPKKLLLLARRGRGRRRRRATPSARRRGWRRSSTAPTRHSRRRSRRGRPRRTSARRSSPATATRSRSSGRRRRRWRPPSRTRRWRWRACCCSGCCAAARCRT